MTPTVEETRHDIIQAICLENAENLVAFCQGLQKGAPVDSYVTPEPWDMPGYTHQVIMAAGTFTSGSSIELSADGPMKDPYSVYSAITIATVLLAVQASTTKDKPAIPSSAPFSLLIFL